MDAKNGVFHVSDGVCDPSGGNEERRKVRRDQSINFNRLRSRRNSLTSSSGRRAS